MTMKMLEYRPTLDPDEIAMRLRQLLVPGPLRDADLESRIRRLDERFRLNAAYSPWGVWAPGMVIPREMTGWTEIYLPLDEIRQAFRRLLALCLGYQSFFTASSFHAATTWLDVLHGLQPVALYANPARLLCRLMDDDDFRCRFLFSLFVPSRYGGRFGRYPVQSAFLQEWLKKTRPNPPLRCLDAACGCGEGSYEMALLLRESGYKPEEIEVHGMTIEPLEVFAGAHAWFPHDPVRQARFRNFIRTRCHDIAEKILFSVGDLRSESIDGPFRIILCNGLLGGPLLNRHEEMDEALLRLVAMLAPGGVLLIADRFHAGWKQTSGDAVRKLLNGNGLTLLPVEEGFAAMR